MGNIKEIHKWVDCVDGFTAEIYCEYDSHTKEVLEESVIFSNKNINYMKEINDKKLSDEAKLKHLKRLPTIFKKK